MSYPVTNVFFSPGGTTKTLALTLAGYLSHQVENLDLLDNPITEPKGFAPEEILVVAMPVFAGRIPSVCLESLSQLKGNNTPVIPVVVYGNRAYDDALLELTDLLTSQGFKILGAGAFIARHSIFPKVAADRPHGNDKAQMKTLGESCLKALKNNCFYQGEIPGNKPYRKAGKLPIAPKGNRKCINCGICAKLCPTGAIPKENGKITLGDQCIACTACIYHCPWQARGFRGVTYALAAKAFGKKCAPPQECELFLPMEG